MAFQTGTQVRPELGRADVSGFANAGMITGQALANLGAQVGGAIAANKEKKANAQLSKAAAGLLFKMAQSNPEGAAGLGIETMEDAAVAVNVIGAKNAMELLQQFGDTDITPVSTGAISSAELEAEAQGYEFNEDTGKYEKKETEAGFFGTLGNILSPGQPFGETYTREMSPEMLQGITGMEQSQMIRAAEARKRRNTNPLDPAGILD